MAHQMALETQQELRKLSGNNKCVDCDAPYPQWATVSYGTFMCLECSGRHRGLGVHISFVRSVTMDSWTDKQIAQMQQGGNDKFRTEFAAAGVPTNLSIQQKYNTPQAEAYRKRLLAQIEGKSPVPLPKWDPTCLPQSASVGSMGASGSARSFSSSGSSSSLGGDTRGVEALKGETEQDYVARQMRLRDEARARMQAKFGAGGMKGIGSGGETGASYSGGAGGISDLTSAFGYLTSTVTSTVSSAASLVREGEIGHKVSSSWSYVQNSIADPNLSNNVKSTASTGWATLSSGATAVWKTAQTVVETAVNSPRNDATNGSNFPRMNPAVASSGKYGGVGNDVTDAKDHCNDSWLDAQLDQSRKASLKSSSFSGSSSSLGVSSDPFASTTSSSSSASSSSSSSVFASKSATSSFSSPPKPKPAVASAPHAPAAATAPVPPPAPMSAPVASKPVKKDHDFFGEFGF